MAKQDKPQKVEIGLPREQIRKERQDILRKIESIGSPKTPPQKPKGK